MTKPLLKDVNSQVDALLKVDRYFKTGDRSEVYSQYFANKPISFQNNKERETIIDNIKAGYVPYKKIQKAYKAHRKPKNVNNACCYYAIFIGKLTELPWYSDNEYDVCEIAKQYQHKVNTLAHEN